MPATEPIRSKSDLRSMSTYFKLRGQYRNNAMIVVGAHTALRISDLLALRWSDVYDPGRGEFRKRFTIREHKTGKHRTVTLHPKAVEALQLLYSYRREDSAYIFTSNRKDGRAISRIQAWRIIRNVVEKLHISGVVAPHSLRKTFGYHAAVKESMSPVLLMEIYNHSSFEVTKQYLASGRKNWMGRICL